MAAYAALVSLTNNIEQILIHPGLSSCLDKKLMASLVEHAGSLLDFVEGHDHSGGIKEAAAADHLECRIAAAAHAAEDVIESHVVRQILAGTNESSRSCSHHLQRIIRDMDAITTSAAEVEEKWRLQEEEPVHSGSPSESGAIAMVGVDAELIHLLDELTSQRPKRHIISIVGMGGMGKTTLARNIYENSLVMHHFDIRAWATISQQYNVKTILLQLVPGLGNFTGGTLDELGERLYRALSGKRYLIVIDDIWSVKFWDEVRHFFPDNRNRSRIVLTTRLSNVAIHCGSVLFKMNLLDVDTSWQLFCEKAFHDEVCPPQLVDVGKEIVRLCKGLPLSIVVIGGLLRKSPRKVRYWKDVEGGLKSIPNSKEKQQILDVLSLSYTHLPSYLKPCFLYMGVFKEDTKIRVSNVINLWIAEGFIKTSGARSLDEIAEDYLQDLIDRNLILDAMHRHSGKVGSCGIHDLLRDLCLKVGEQQEFFQSVQGTRRGAERRLIRNCYLLQAAPPLARSILARNRVEQPVKNGLLRVLTEARHESPTEYYRNVNLRYLAYEHPWRRSQPVWELPTLVSLIWNLQTLIIRNSRSTVVVAPVEIWKMRHLRHLKCDHFYLPHPPTRNGQDEQLLVLDNMRTLKTIVNLRLCEQVCAIVPNIKKLHLVYHRDLHGYDDGLADCLRSLPHLHKLEMLNISIISSRWPTPDTELHKMLVFPASLTKLSLSNCQLHWEDLLTIGWLPQLQVLKLEIHSVMLGDRWSPVNGQFLRLKILRVCYCNLIHWYADSSHFPVLEKLVLNHLPYLKEIPWGIGEIPTLELICVELCSESAAISAVRMKEDQLQTWGNDGLQVHLKISKSELDRFTVTIEIEELTLSNIVLEIY